MDEYKIYWFREVRSNIVLMAIVAREKESIDRTLNFIRLVMPWAKVVVDIDETIGKVRVGNKFELEIKLKAQKDYLNSLMDVVRILSDEELHN